jgi:hypothetical protein
MAACLSSWRERNSGADFPENSRDGEPVRGRIPRIGNGPMTGVEEQAAGRHDSNLSD